MTDMQPEVTQIENEVPALKPLTERQTEVLNAITSYIDANDVPPSMTELADTLGISYHGAFIHVRTLALKGYIEPSTGDRKARNMKVLFYADGEPFQSRATLLSYNEALRSTLQLMEMREKQLQAQIDQLLSA